MRTDIEGVAFDLDGTLYPNHRLYARLIPLSINRINLLVAFGKARSIIRKEQESPSYNIMEGNGFYNYQAEITGSLMKKSGSAQSVNEEIEKYFYKTWEMLFKKIRLFKGAAETLAALRKSGYKLGLLSDFPPEIKLEYLGLGGIWDAVLCSEYCGVLKPHPLPFIKLAQAMSITPEKILYVGNSYSYDVTGANRAGMKTAWIKSKFPPAGKKDPAADFIFNNYRQLYNYMIN